MNYNRPELGERLAADYVLGMMPARARRRFERAMAGNATLAASVAGWSDRLAPLDTITAAETPPARVWRAIERRVGPDVSPAKRQRPLAVAWRCFALAAMAAGAAVVLYIAIEPRTLPDKVHALAKKTGLPDLMASAKRSPTDLGLSTMSLGVSERERPRWLRAALLLTNDALPLTREPPAPPR